tara:strand:+ start:8209 stop:9165 length:957 start_codon:yes stop_codon:yes gene_type:complete
MINVFGQRPPTVWGDVEKKIGRGFANRFLDRVGVQYGLRAFEAGAITAEQFVDLNERIGGWDIDTRWQPERTTGDRFAIEQMYRNGLIVDGRLLAKVAIIDYRRTTRADIHSNRQAAFVRERMLRSNGTAASRAEWIEPNPSPAKAEIDDGSRGSAAVDEKLTLRVLDEWLSRIEADRSDLAIEQKIVRNKPPEAADGCFEGGQRIGAKACASYELDSDPLLVAGMPAARDILKCQLKPLRRADYRASFTTAQWDRLEQTFASGVCDWSKPGVGQQSNIPWLTYEKGAPGKPFADEQQVRKFGDQMSRRIGGQNAGQR